MIRIGLTGGIGSGKTTVARIFELLGVPVYYADERGRWLSDHSEEVILKIKALFGEEAYLPDGKMDRRRIAGRVFSDHYLLERLNRIIHPAVREDYRTWVARHQNAVYSLLESAILFESGFDSETERVIVVTAPEELRIRRTILRDHTDSETVRTRIRAQIPEEERVARSNYVLTADERELLIPQIIGLHRQLLRT